jgi:S-DNA-T family DNA segregation ATPase FtsK/SpoIIIE
MEQYTSLAPEVERVLTRPALPRGRGRTARRAAVAPAARRVRTRRGSAWWRDQRVIAAAAALALAGSSLLTLLLWEHPLTAEPLRQAGLLVVAGIAAALWSAVLFTLWALAVDTLPPLPRLAAWALLHVGAVVGGTALAGWLSGTSPYDLVALVLHAAGLPGVAVALGVTVSASLALALAYTNERAVRTLRGLARLAAQAARSGSLALRLIGRGLVAAASYLRTASPLLVARGRVACARAIATLRAAVPRRAASPASTLPQGEALDPDPRADPAPPHQPASVERAEPTAARRPTAVTQSTAPAPSETGGPGRWQLPPLTLLELPPENGSAQASAERIGQLERKIERTLGEFDIPVKVVEVRAGPTVTQFGVEPGYREKRDRKGALVRRERVKVREILARQHDLALALAAPTIRIEAPVPGRPVVGIEVPNQAKAVVALRGLLESEQFRRLRERGRLPLALGEHLSKEAVVADLAKMPHLLIAGATGSGKSVCINALIATLLMFHTPDTLRLLLVDPKRVEMTAYQDLPHLLAPVVVDAERTVPALRLVLQEMDQRYRAFAEAGVRNIDGWNRLGGERPRLPYIVVIIDELADLMMLAPDEVERSICRLAQLARATGIHLVVATQRPSVDVVTGLIKANIPTRISFMVTSQVDSRTILDMTGAEKLLGSGDMLYMPTDVAKPLRLQGTYVSDDEIESIVQFWTRQGRPQYAPDFANLPAWSPHDDGDEDDELFEAAVEIAQQLADQGKDVSVSFLQRRLRIGYNRAARLKERLVNEGLLGDLPDDPEAFELARAGDADDEV